MSEGKGKKAGSLASMVRRNCLMLAACLRATFWAVLYLPKSSSLLWVVKEAAWLPYLSASRCHVRLLSLSWSIFRLKVRKFRREFRSFRLAFRKVFLEHRPNANKLVKRLFYTPVADLKFLANVCVNIVHGVSPCYVVRVK